MVAEKCITIKVVKPAEFSITDIRADRTTITEGESVKVTVTVTNTGGTSGTATVGLYVDGKFIKGESVYIGAGTSRTIEFSVSGLTAGTHTICAKIEWGEDHR